MSSAALTMLLLWGSVIQDTTGLYSAPPLYKATATAIPIPTTTATTTATVVRPAPLQLSLEAVPDNPVTEGCSVTLRCRALGGRVIGPILWTLRRDGNVTVVGRGAELRLTHPEQSGPYCCNSSDGSFMASEEHWVYIVAEHRSASDLLGVIGFVVSVVAFVSIVVLGVRLFRKTLSITATTAAQSRDPARPPDVSEISAAADGEHDVYMNYSNEGYTDLDPSNIHEDNVYSSFS